MEEAVIRKLIKTAVRQLSYSYAPYSHFKVGAALWQRTEQFIQDAILKMPRILRPIAQSGPLLKRSVKGSERSKPSVLPGV